MVLGGLICILGFSMWCMVFGGGFYVGCLGGPEVGVPVHIIWPMGVPKHAVWPQGGSPFACVAQCWGGVVHMLPPDKCFPPPSPQGHNRLIAYSRPVYFCLACALIWGLDAAARAPPAPPPAPTPLCGLPLLTPAAARAARDVATGETQTPGGLWGGGGAPWGCLTDPPW